MHQNSSNKKNSILIACLVSALSAISQQHLGDIETSLNEYRDYNFAEKIFTHTDKNFYLAGEIIWFKLYVVNAENNKPVDLSKVAYVEIHDKNRQPVLQGKIALNEAKGSGSLYLPFSLNSGVYKLRAYTNWMKNFDESFYFEKTITIINSLKNFNVQSAPLRNYDLQFFPEGGNFVQGIENRTAFKLVDQSGKGVDCRGYVVNNNGDTLTEFRTLKFGIGNFKFVPASGTSYKAIVKLPDTIIMRELPKTLEQGYVLRVNNINESQFRVSISTNIKSAEFVYLFVHTRQIPKIEKKLLLTNGVAELVIDKNNLGEGISHITVFNSETMPVCERLFFIRPTQKLIIQSSVDGSQFTSRKKVRITVSSVDELKRSVPADMSISIYRSDSLGIQNADIDNYFWLTSELKGNIESPAYYFSEVGPEVDEAIDNLMLTHGWRRFTWKDVLQRRKPTYPFVPEYKGHIIYGKVTNTKTGLPAANVLTYLSVPGSRVQLYSSRSDPAGSVRFYTKDFFGPNEIVLQTDNRTDTTYKLEIISPFSNKFPTGSLPFFDLSQNVKNLLTDYSVSMQVQNNFIGEKLKQFYTPVVDTNAFFGNPDKEYLLDNYTRFSTMEEVLREYVYEVLVRRQKENFHLIMADADNKIFLNDPFTLFNGVPVFDPNKLIKYDPLKVKKIDIVKRKYFYGPLIFNGIVNFTTYSPDPSMLAELDPVIMEYEGLQYQREFYSPVYETQEEISSRLPDFRNVLYWSPGVQTDAQGTTEIDCFTSDLKGKFIVVLQGMTVDGRTGEKSISFEVR